MFLTKRKLHLVDSTCSRLPPVPTEGDVTVRRSRRRTALAPGRGVVGRSALSRRYRWRVVRPLRKPDVHIFVHTHFGWDTVLDGVRYVQAVVC